MTRSRTLLTWLGLAVSVALVATACGRTPGKKGAGGGESAPAAAKVPPKGFMVVQIDEEIRVIPKANLDALRQELKTEHSQAMARYEEEQQAAEKNNAAFEKPVPLLRKLKLSRETFATEEEAAAYRDKLLAKRKAAAAKTAVKRKTPTEPPAEPTEPEGGGDEGGRP